MIWPHANFEYHGGRAPRVHVPSPRPKWFDLGPRMAVTGQWIFESTLGGEHEKLWSWTCHRCYHPADPRSSCHESEDLETNNIKIYLTGDWNQIGHTLGYALCMSRWTSACIRDETHVSILQHIHMYVYIYRCILYQLLPTYTKHVYICKVYQINQASLILGFPKRIHLQISAYLQTQMFTKYHT